ncbi:aldose 1-epimerase [soil metagenome]
MFDIKSIQKNGFNEVILTDNISNTFVAIVPSCGAILQSFSVVHAGTILNVIDSFNDEKDFTENVTSKGFKGCKLSPFACRMNECTYHFGEKNYTIKKFLLGKHAMHGLIYDAPFEIINQVQQATFAELTMMYAYRGEETGYPFNYDCIITYKLAEYNTLTVSTKIINQDKGLIPVQDGWHPYFKLGDLIDDLQLEFQSKEILEFNEELIPTGKLFPYQKYGAIRKLGDEIFDNCYTLNFSECQPLCVLRHPGKKIQLEFYPDRSYPYLQIFTPDDRKSIAIENLSAAPNAFNNKMGLRVLEPAQEMTFVTTYKITSLI